MRFSVENLPNKTLEALRDYVWRGFNRLKSIIDEIAFRIEGDFWEDNTAEFTGGAPGASAPSLTTFRGGPARQYVFGVGDSVDVVFHIKHDVKPGTSGGIFHPHVHWTTNGTNAGTLTWRLSYHIAKGHNQEAFPVASVLDLTDTASGIAWQHMITESVSGFTTPEVDSLIIVNVELLSATGFGTPADDIFGLYVDLHYQKDRLGTPQKAPDFYAGGQSV